MKEKTGFQILKAKYEHGSDGDFELVRHDSQYYVGWEASQAIYNPNWGYHYTVFDNLAMAEEYFDYLCTR